MLWAALGAWMIAAPADDAAAQRRACLAECDAAGTSDTDRETCRLQCEHSETRPGVVRWKQTRLLGGSPDGGTTTTVTEQHPDGTTTSSTTFTHERGDAPPPTGASVTNPASADTSSPPVVPVRTVPPRSLRADQATCQSVCDPLGVARERARCKLACVRPASRAGTKATTRPPS